jgi:hypothetical protein
MQPQLTKPKPVPECFLKIFLTLSKIDASAVTAPQ